MGLLDKIKQIKHAWNAFLADDVERRAHVPSEGAAFGPRPDRVRFRWSSERSIVAGIYTRLSIDAAAIDLRHVKLDDENRYLEDINSGLNECLTVEANIDQGARHFRQDIFMSLFEQGVIGIVPVDTNIDPEQTAGFNILSMRVGEIVGWFSKHIRMNLYNEKKCAREQITLEKRFVGVVENPFYAVMNEPNSTLQRLIRKLNLLDAVDEASSSGKLDIIIQLPYIIKSEARRQQAEQRRKDVEFQLAGSKYGIAYVDGTEKITQLNRPAENNLLKQIEYLTAMVYGQLGLTPEIMNGTADEKAMLNYYMRTIEPLTAVVMEAMRRAFLSKTARTQKQWILGFRNPFSYVSMKDMAEIGDKFTRNEIMTANELRQAMGLRPSKDPKADELRNSNMPAPSEPNQPNTEVTEGDGQNGSS